VCNTTTASSYWTKVVCYSPEGPMAHNRFHAETWAIRQEFHMLSTHDQTWTEEC